VDSKTETVQQVTVDEIVDRLEESGYATIPGAIAAHQVAWARSELEDIVESTPRGRDDFEGHRTRRVYGLFAKTRSLDALAVHDVVLGVLDRVLRHYQLSAPTGISIGPGETAQPLHPDDAIYPLPRPHPEIVVNVMWPLQDFTAANGATRIVAGSHRWVDERPGPDTATTTVELPAGREPRPRRSPGGRLRLARTPPGAARLQHPSTVHRLRRRPASPQADRRGRLGGVGVRPEPVTEVGD